MKTQTEKLTEGLSIELIEKMGFLYSDKEQQLIKNYIRKQKIKNLYNQKQK